MSKTKIKWPLRNKLYVYGKWFFFKFFYVSVTTAVFKLYDLCLRKIGNIMHESLQNNLQYSATVVVIYYNIGGVGFYFKNKVWVGTF